MNLLLAFLALVSFVYVYGQGEKSSSMIPFPRIGRAQGSSLPGLIPFPRIGRSGIQEGKRQLIPFPRVGKRPSWHYYLEPNFFEYEDLLYPFPEVSSSSSLLNSLSSNSEAAAASSNSNADGGGEESQVVGKRNPNNGAGSNAMWFGPRLGK